MCVCVGISLKYLKILNSQIEKVSEMSWSDLIDVADPSVMNEMRCVTYIHSQFLYPYQVQICLYYMPWYVLKVYCLVFFDDMLHFELFSVRTT